MARIDLLGYMLTVLSTWTKYVIAKPAEYTYCTQSSNVTVIDCSIINIKNLYNNIKAITNPSAIKTLNITVKSDQILNDRLFIGYDSLSVLYYQRNNLSVIKQDVFVGLNKLRSLYLDYNNLETLPANVFENVINLKELHVSHNNIHRLNNDIFKHLGNLELLNLESNAIALIDTKAFVGLHKIQHINLARNQLSHIVNGTFHAVSTLKGLNLSSNRLDVIDGTTFVPLRMLNMLDISWNNLVNIHHKSVTIFSNMSNLKSFNISHNPMNCDCNINKFINWITNVDYINSNNLPSCTSPRELANVNLSNISLSSIPRCIIDPSMHTQRSTTKTYINNSLFMRFPYNSYNPMLGWYTAVVLMAVLLVFLFCLMLDKLKRRYYRYLKRKLKKIERKEKLRLASENQEITKDSVESSSMLCSVAEEPNIDGISEHIEEIASEECVPASNISTNRKVSICSNVSFKTVYIQDNIPVSIERKVSISSKSERKVSIENVIDLNTDRKIGTDNTLSTDRKIGTDVTLRKSDSAKGFQPVSALNRKNSAHIISPLELVPGVTILEINPDCPLHGTGKKAAVISQGAYNVFYNNNNLPNNIPVQMVSAKKR